MNRDCQIIFSSSFFDAESIVAKVINEYSDFHEISIRDVLKDQLKKRTEPLTREINSYIGNNKLIPTYLMNKLIEQEIDVTQKAILIQQYPRTIEQYMHLEDLLIRKRIKISRLWFLQLINPEALPRYVASYTESYDELKKSINRPEISVEIDFKYPTAKNSEELIARTRYAIETNQHEKVNPTNVSSNEFFGFSRDGKVEIHFYYNSSNSSIISYFPKK